MKSTQKERFGLYRPEFEKDGCGFGLIAQMDNQPSHWLVKTAISALTCLTHRGAIAADGKTGDGCGLLLKIPEAFCREKAADLKISLDKKFAVGMVFLNQQAELAAAAKACLEAQITRQGLSVAGWREVPIDSNACGEEALASLPRIEQIFVNAPPSLDDEALERKLFFARRRTEKTIAPEDQTFYIASLSARVISYKGLVMPSHLEEFYLDLHDDNLHSSLCVFHQRFSTNTWPEWRLAQPFRYLAHNGEINTIQGNRNWATARGSNFSSPLIPESDDIVPFVARKSSDSSSLDNMLEVMLAGGMDLFRAMRMLVPAAWQNVDTMDADLQAFYEYQSKHMEPWDGPAGIVLTDGRYAGCVLDRNGLRPARYVMTKDRHITLASEVGVYDYKPEDVVAKGRLKPGQMMAVDLQTGTLMKPDDIDHLLKHRKPYREWLNQHVTRLESQIGGCVLTQNPFDGETLNRHLKMFQVTYEEKDQILKVLANAGQEAVGSMGDDTPMSVLSQRVRSLYDYFRQQFAQVTNPPIDPLREQIVMSLETCFGREPNLYDDASGNSVRLLVDSPVLSESKYERLMAIDNDHLANYTVDLTYPVGGNLKDEIIRVCDEIVEQVRAGKVIIVLSDRNIKKGFEPIHALLATGAAHHRLINEGLRCKANLLVDTATARDPHHFATLIAYGATAIYPYLAYECLQEMLESGDIKKKTSKSVTKAYCAGINKGLFKITSKMGISTIASYRGAQLFEIVGLDNDVVSMCFRGTPNRIQGASFVDLQQDQSVLTDLAWNNRKKIEPGGLLKYIHGQEFHAYNPDVIKSLQLAAQSGQYADYKKFAVLVNERPVAAIRDMFSLAPSAQSISIDDVEPVSDIVMRFNTAAMSLGALSPEAHEALAVAMNRLGGRSNSGEGGEDISRYGTEKVSKIKQIASGRFGVTPHYLVNAEVLQIKIAQGAKPGEGGQLPGDKVNEMIAELRFSIPGVALISPPPHHDIYSIEDLAQLIFDLKQVNPTAQVSVKLVSGPGVGTIAAGVAKAYADFITISGHDGGTGASPLTSVRYAGTPWELGLAETHQTLRANNLREKVILQTDGGLKTGLDVVKAAILGAESYGFGTGPMVALGCKYLRICHLNNCATGVATQNNVLRMKHFIGLPEMVMNYITGVAQEVREILAVLGIKRLDDVIGQTDLLKINEASTLKQQKLDLSPILSQEGADKNSPQISAGVNNDPFDKGVLAEQMVSEMLAAIEGQKGGVFSYRIQNHDRSIGARLSGEIAQRYGNQGLSETPVTLQLHGSAGQSLGVWNAGGLHINLVGDANDYVGKGMAGGKIVVSPPMESTFKSNETVIIGNTCLYGATGGALYASGLAGERFAVRNSGAHAVVEGVGDHGCEYMTGGSVVILGETGLNFGAGMTGGFAFVLDQKNQFVDRYNHELIDIHRVHTQHMEAYQSYLRESIQHFVKETNSAWAQSILDDFSHFLNRFWLVTPKAADLQSLLDLLNEAA